MLQVLKIRSRLQNTHQLSLFEGYSSMEMAGSKDDAEKVRLHSNILKR